MLCSPFDCCVISLELRCCFFIIFSDGEGIVQLGKKSDSLKSVNQEIGVSDGDVAGTLKVESSVGKLLVLS